MVAIGGRVIRPAEVFAVGRDFVDGRVTIASAEFAASGSIGVDTDKLII